MEMISRRAYGFRNFENYRIRVMTHCGWVRTARKQGIPGPVSGPNARQVDVELEAATMEGLNLVGGNQLLLITSR